MKIRCIPVIVLAALLVSCANLPIDRNAEGIMNISSTVAAWLPRYEFQSIEGRIEVGFGHIEVRAKDGRIIGDNLVISEIVFDVKGGPGYARGILKNFTVPLNQPVK